MRYVLEPNLVDFWMEMQISVWFLFNVFNQFRWSLLLLGNW